MVWRVLFMFCVWDTFSFLVYIVSVLMGISTYSVRCVAWGFLGISGLLSTYVEPLRAVRLHGVLFVAWHFFGWS